MSTATFQEILLGRMSAELLAQTARANRYEAALRMWKCWLCHGRGTDTCNCDKQRCYDWCRSGNPCEKCDGTGIDAIAREALAFEASA